MGLPSKEQTDYYEKYWNKIEQCTDNEVSLFVRDWLSVKQQVTPAISRIYKDAVFDTNRKSLLRHISAEKGLK